MAYQNKIIKKTSYDNDIYRTFYFFHNEGDKSISIGKISKRPTNISKDKTILEIHEGIKVSRIVIYVKNAFSEMRRMLHPHSVVSVNFEGKHLEKSVINNIHAYLILYSIIFCTSFLIIALQNIDFTSAFSSVATCINNVGPGLGIVGPTGNFSSLSWISKIVLSFDMFMWS